MLPNSRSEVEETKAEQVKRMLSSNIEKYNHLLVGKVRDTQMMFSFIVEASIIDTDKALNAGAAGASAGVQ